MTEQDFSNLLEALRQNRQSEAEVSAIKEVLMTWKISGEGEEPDQDVYGQYDAWMAVLSLVEQRLGEAGDILSALTEKYSPFMSVSSATETE